MSLKRQIALSAGLIAAAGIAMPDARSDGYQSFDPTPAWPLCGQIYRLAEQPAGWTEEQGCPQERWGDPDHSDHKPNPGDPNGSIRNGYGYRVLANGNIDFHRAIDIPAPIDTPVFAISRGIVRSVTIDSDTDDGSTAKIKIRHFRPGSWGECRPNGCYHSVYTHLRIQSLSAALVAEGDVVEKGQLIGHTYGTESFPHLHFEILNAPAGDSFANTLHNAISPLRVLPYHHANAAATQLTIDSVDATDPMSPIVTVKVEQSATDKTYDINLVEVEVYDNRTRTSVPQPGIVKDADGFNLHPPRLDFEERNHQYTHRFTDNENDPWEAAPTCPFRHEHPTEFSAEVHVNRPDPNDNSISDFNGIKVEPEPNSSTDPYEFKITFKEIVGVMDADDLCIVVNAKNARGAFAKPVRSANCSF